MRRLLVHRSCSASLHGDSSLGGSRGDLRRLWSFSFTRSWARRLTDRSSSRGRRDSRSVFMDSYGASSWHRHFKEGM